MRTQNSARSQMAEALLRHHAGDRFEAYSAGCEAADEIHPYVERVMDGEHMEAERREALNRGDSFAVPADIGHSGTAYHARLKACAS